MLKKNLPVIMVVLLMLLLIALVIRIYEKRMREIDKKMHQSFITQTESYKYSSILNPQKYTYEKNVYHFLPAA